MNFGGSLRVGAVFSVSGSKSHAGTSVTMFRRRPHGIVDIEHAPSSPSFAGTGADVLSNENQILLQCFNWECWSCRDPSWWTILKFKAQTIADAGITSCWLPPPSLAVDQQVGGDWLAIVKYAGLHFLA